MLGATYQSALLLRRKDRKTNTCLRYSVSSRISNAYDVHQVEKYTGKELYMYVKLEAQVYVWALAWPGLANE